MAPPTVSSTHCSAMQPSRRCGRWYGRRSPPLLPRRSSRNQRFAHLRAGRRQERSEIFSGRGRGPKGRHLLRAGSTTITITSSSNAMANLADILSRSLDRIIIDKTGLQGNFSINLRFAPDNSRFVLLDSTVTPALDARPSVFTAVSEQLGLALKSERDPIDVLVIDRVEMPSENRDSPPPGLRAF